MGKHFIISCLRVSKLFILGIILVLCFHSSSYSQIGEQKWDKKTGRIVVKAMKAEQSGNPEKALKMYDKLLQNHELNPYETSIIYKFKGSAEGKLKKYDLELESLRKAIDAGGLDKATVVIVEKYIKSREVINREGYVPPAKPIGDFKIMKKIPSPALGDGKSVEFIVPSVLSCDTNMPDVCYKKAINLHYGKDGPKDKAMAHGIFSELCEKNLGKACHAASMAFNRYSSHPDYQKYLYFQAKGCELGTPVSCFVLGRSYEGPWAEGVTANHSKARKYFKRACKLGYSLGCQYAKVKATGHRL